MPGTKPGIIYFESFIKKSLAEALTHRCFQSASANEPSASRLCQSDGTLSQPAGRLTGWHEEWGHARSTLLPLPVQVAMSMLAKLTGQQPQPNATWPS